MSLAFLIDASLPSRSLGESDANGRCFPPGRAFAQFQRGFSPSPSLSGHFEGGARKTAVHREDVLIAMSEEPDGAAEKPRPDVASVVSGVFNAVAADLQGLTGAAIDVNAHMEKAKRTATGGEGPNAADVAAGAIRALQADLSGLAGGNADANAPDADADGGVKGPTAADIAAGAVRAMVEDVEAVVKQSKATALRLRNAVPHVEVVDIQSHLQRAGDGIASIGEATIATVQKAAADAKTNAEAGLARAQDHTLAAKEHALSAVDAGASSTAAAAPLMQGTAAASGPAARRCGSFGTPCHMSAPRVHVLGRHCQFCRRWFRSVQRRSLSRC